MKKSDKIIVIVGPTASGKSAYAVRLAKKIGGEVISADSRQVYKGLDIGTGKITRREMKGVPHHLLDIASPKRVFTAHDYAEMARPIMGDILARGKTPIICGGTGFYIDALLGRVSLPDVPPNPKLRARLAKMSAEKLFSMLLKLDPERANAIDKHNPVRIIRAIEIATALGKVPPGTLKTSDVLNTSFVNPYFEWIGLRPDTETLRKKIRARLHERMRRGMVAEARRLHAHGLSWKRMEVLGLEYRYLARYLRDTISKEEMLAQLELEIWQYAKRQMTYWRKNTMIKWLSVGNLTNA